MGEKEKPFLLSKHATRKYILDEASYLAPKITQISPKFLDKVNQVAIDYIRDVLFSHKGKEKQLK